MKTIGYVCQSDPFHDRGAWSGTMYKLREAIEKSGFRIIWIPYKPSRKIVWILSHLLRIFNKQTIIYTAFPQFLKSCAKSIDLNLVEKCDVLFFPGLAGMMQYIGSKKPFIYFSDATFCQMVDYYWFGLDKLTLHYGNKLEAWAIQNCSLKISSSHWAASSAELDYGCNPEKNYVIPFGANIDEEDIVHAGHNKKESFKFLFSGVEWERKGAAIAIAAVKELNKRGINSKLILCGIKKIPEEYGPLPNCVEYLGFLNKNIPEEYEKYISAVRESDALILPTSAECAGIVFCEAAGNGLPVFTFDTGGIGDYIINNKNGIRLPLGATAKDYADVVEKCIKSDQLVSLSKGARELYEKSLNWNRWSESFKTILENHFSVGHGK